jgi:cytidylate kinase
MGLSFLDTGAMYRCVAVACIRAGVTADDADAATRIALSCDIRFEPGDPQRVLLNGEDVTNEIRLPEIGDFASAVSVHSGVRKQLVEQQKSIVSQGGVILEGRDTTTVVAPNATVKIYLTAGIDIRANRRYRELCDKGMSVDLDDLKRQIIERDQRDSTRADSPLSIAEGALVLDTDNLNIAQVVAEVERLAKSAQNA